MSLRRSNVKSVAGRPSIWDQYGSEWIPDGEGTGVPKDWLGVDVGFIYPAADSDGRIYRWSAGKRRVSKRGDFTTAGPVTVRRADGTTYVQGAYNDAALADIAARSRDENYRIRIWQIASTVVNQAKKTERGLVLEDWRDFKRRRAAWMDLWRTIMRFAKDRGVAVRTVPSAFTSLTCPECGHISKGNRPTRNKFCCVKCGHSAQSDRVAARNIKNRVNEPRTDHEATCSNKACDRPVWKVGKCCSCYFFQRRWGIYPNEQELEELRAAKNYGEFQRLVEEVHLRYFVSPMYGARRKSPI